MKVALTGFGMIDSLGNNPNECWNRMIDNQDYGFKPKGIDKEPRSLYYAEYVTEQALKMASIESQNVGVFFSTTCSKEYEREMLASSRFYPKKALNILSDSISSYIAQKYKFLGQNVCLRAACATGIMTIDFAMKYVDDYDFVVVGGSDYGHNDIDMSLFNTLRARGTKSMPFDKKRDGFIMGAGAGALILESEEKAKKRNAKILAWLYPAKHATDSHRTQPSGIGAYETMKDQTFDVVNAHGTSTQIGDKVEYESIRKISNAPIYSCKGKIGHTMAAAGILETIYSVMSMQHGIIPHCHGTTQPEYDVVTKPIKMNINRTINNSFGFGGKCAAQVIELC